MTANHKNTTGVTVIGLGPMGQAITRSLLQKGISVTVWNRTASKADDLVAAGALRAATVADALQANELVLLSLTHYQAMYDILQPAAQALAGKVLVNLSSDTPEKAREAAVWAAANGAQFLAGGIMVTPQQVGHPGSFAFFSGPQELFEAHQPILSIIGDTDYRGSDPGLAPLYYQALLDIMFTSVAGIMHGMALIKSANIPAATFAPYVDNFLVFLRQLVSDLQMAQEADKGSYDGSHNNMLMMTAGIHHITDASADAGVNTSLPAAVKDIFDRTVAKGHGKDGLASIFEVLRQKD
ncbi:NAD(P)-dependent oxidoreductase [Chitinophaga nivalis]|uniref:NAD(P)-binding domain-containing protein n=1 Tax=Chitinophaga nivalis TaxID=2991709 RepID=A0ABT3IGT1_9BACT|nr:NAD(P)-binding domain-containing protein [Chitinophaga nivalis]MCW3467140.1 NAD(P)-binding domain-containing protein [Chitinophaga nivalis]MCW3483169.1 NAD(P)-binding domain-containing protein [Chitinophaga nivalis]